MQTDVPTQYPWANNLVEDNLVKQDVESHNEQHELNSAADKRDTSDEENRGQSSNIGHRIQHARDRAEQQRVWHAKNRQQAPSGQAVESGDQHKSPHVLGKNHGHLGHERLDDRTPLARDHKQTLGQDQMEIL